jgi:hypothetical protein
MNEEPGYKPEDEQSRLSKDSTERPLFSEAKIDAEIKEIQIGLWEMFSPDGAYFTSAGYDAVQRARAQEVEDVILVPEAEEESEERQNISLLYSGYRNGGTSYLSFIPRGEKGNHGFHFVYSTDSDQTAQLRRSFTGQSNFSDMPQVEIEASILPSSFVNAPTVDTQQLADAIYTRVIPGSDTQTGVKEKGMKGVVQTLLGKNAKVRWEDQETQLELVVTRTDDRGIQHEDRWRRLTTKIGQPDQWGSDEEEYIVFARKPEKPTKGKKDSQKESSAVPVSPVLKPTLG